MALPIGTVLDGKFKIVQILGEGGMGTVYKVQQIGTTPPYYYAVKELLINLNTSEEDRKAAIERFNKEIALLRGLKHPRIAALALPFQDRGNYYFAMEFVPGRSLEKILEDSKGPLPEEQVIHWMIQVCEALTYIHTRTPPIILRDLKPGNIMISPDNEVQLIDFGIARRFDPNKRTNTENLGTISYASPEHLGSITAPGQKRTAQNPGTLVQTDARSDIYSLGATMYHLLTNYEPDPIQTPPPGSLRAKNRLLRTTSVNGQTACPSEQVVIKAMQQLPAQRFQTAEAMRVALQHCLPNNAPPATIQIPLVSPNATIIVPATTNNGNGQGLICSRCGLVNRPGAKFCAHDGQPLVQGAAIAPPQARPMTYRNAPLQARPVQRPIQTQPGQSIRARPVARPAPAIKAQPIQASKSNGVAAADPNATYRQGLQYLMNKNYAEAVNQFKLARAQGAPLYDVLYNLGRAYRQYGQMVKDTDKKLFTDNMKFGAEQFEEAVRHKSDASDAYFQLGMCYRDLAFYAQAVGAFKQALHLTPKDTAIYYQLGMIALEQSAYRDAEGYFKEGLQINPDHALILIAMGRLYGETRQYAAAISTLRQATQIDPALWEGWYELGRTHMKMREWKPALSALERARQIGIHIADIYSAMATCQLKLNKKAEARQLLTEALQRDPNNAEALRLQKQL
ncbi:MAG TPA: protein kinase [Ktedonobacteraceae bacterium]|jgi:serine/threonine protein kinase/tetratricopeptide (TPR) repeat protein|nr:protein kinase [Ktedonobacteraceae bacterium]